MALHSCVLAQGMHSRPSDIPEADLFCNVQVHQMSHPHPHLVSLARTQALLLLHWLLLLAQC
jgi:hypothetical protein